MTNATAHNDKMTEQQRAHIAHMTQQYRRFAEAIERLNAGVGRYANVVEQVRLDMRVNRAA